jgi:hypothetical protein
MENIEAMLCAYVEGDLDEAGRKEIEKHLAEHPQHKKLLEDLIAQRQLLRDLPRINAPGDVNEELRGQTERSILLGSQDSMQLPRPPRGFRLPQYITAAAILMLGASLVIIVYRVVVPTFKPANYTQVSPSAADQKTRSEIEADIEASKAETPAPSAANPATQPSPAEVAAAPSAVYGVPSAALAARAPAQFGPVPAPIVDWNQIRDELKSSGYDITKPAAGKPAPLVFVVGAPDTLAAGRQISQFLSTQSGISWWSVPEGATTQPAMTRQLAQATTLPSAQQLANTNANFTEQIAQRVYVVCNLNPQQAADLQEALNNQPPESVPTVQLSDEAVRTISAASAAQVVPSDGLLDRAAAPTTKPTTMPSLESSVSPSSEPATTPSGPALVDAIIVVRSASTVVNPALQTQPTTIPAVPLMPPGATTTTAPDHP